MVRDVNPQIARSHSSRWENRFSVANDVAVGHLPPEGRFFKRFLIACGAFAFFAAAGGIAALTLPGDTRYEARVLAVMPQADDAKQVNPSMSDVVRYARTVMSSQNTLNAAKARFGDDRAKTITIGEESDAPVITVSTSLKDAFFASQTVDYFAGLLTSVKDVEPGADGARRALQQTLDDARAELEAFDAEMASDPANVAEINPSDTAELKEAAEAARERAVAAGQLSLKSVLAGQVSPDIMTPTLSSLLEQYLNAEAELQALGDKLGPRHPQYVAAKTYLSTAKTKMTEEIRRIVKSARADTQAAAAEQMKAEKESAEMASRQEDSVAHRQELQMAVQAAEANLSSFDKAAEPLPPARFRLISPATLVDEPNEASGMLILAGLASGALAALFILLQTGRREARTGSAREDAAFGTVHERDLEAAVLEDFDALRGDVRVADWQESLPYAANDEEVQTYSPEVRALAMRLATLRKQVEEIAGVESQPSLEETLVEMRRIRQKVHQLKKSAS